jgi:putative ABC transport system permease protein
VISWLRRSLLRFISLFRRDMLDRDLGAEVSAHVALAIQENHRAGMSPAEAKRQALIQFSGAQQATENHRDARGLPWLETVLQDFRYASRILRKSPGFTIIAVAALALGIGFSTTVFSIFYNGVLHPFAYRDANRLTVIGIVDTAHSNGYRSMFHLNEIAAFRKQSQSLEDVVAYSGWDTTFFNHGTSEPVHICVSSPNMISFWGMQPVLGRGITEQDAGPGAPPIALLGYDFWKKTYGGDKSVIGSTIIVNKQPRTIIGVMPHRFALYGADFYIPIDWNRPEPANYQQAADTNDPWYFFANALVKPKVTLQTAAADLQVVSKQLVAIYPKDYPEHFQMTVRPFNEALVQDFPKTLALLAGAVLLLLLISSSNVASLLLTHHTARAREIALRTALGASRGRLVRQLFLESLLLGLVGCLAGSLLAYLGLGVIYLVPGLSVPGEADLSLNLPVLFFAIALSLVTTFFFGLSPALLAVKKDLRSVLQSSGVNANAAHGGTRVRSGLVVGQVALSVLLLVFAGLMIRSFLAIYNFNPGMSTSGLFFSDIHFPSHGYETAESKRAFLEETLARTSVLPGVTHAAISFGIPTLGGPRSDDITIPGKPHDKPWTTSFDAVSQSYFSTVGLQLLRGRLLSSDDIVGARRVAVVSDSLVKTYFPSEDPLGRQIKFNALDQEPDTPHNAYYEIVGVVTDLKNFSGSRWESPHSTSIPQAYIPYTFASVFDRSLLVRTVTNPARLNNPVRQLLADIDSNVVLEHPTSLEDELQKYVFQKPKFRLVSFGTCAAIGMVLALIGLFGIMSYSVSLQTHELGIRMALGAQPHNILTLVLRKGLLLVGSGIVLGLIVAFLSVRILQSQLYGVSAFDPWTLVLAPATLVAAALLACYLPARRATRVDPMIALRYE